MLNISTDVIINEILKLLLGTDDDRKQFQTILDALPGYDQQMVLNTALRTLSTRYLASSSVTDDLEWWQADAGLISSAAAYINCIVSKDETRKTQLINWLTKLSGAGVGDGIRIRRAVIAVLSDSKYDIETVLEKSLQQFGDPLYIKHAPSLQQDGMLQSLLCSCPLLTAGQSSFSSAPTFCRLCV